MNVVVCDDHRLFADCFADVLGARGHRVVTTASPEEALAAIVTGAEGAAVDVCVMDLMFPGRMDAFDAIAEISTASPSTRVIVLSACAPAFGEARSLDAGALDFVMKDDLVDRVIDAVEGNAEVKPRAARGGGIRLTAREREVLERLVRGERTRAIAGAMGVSYSTARSHVQSVLHKLGVHSRLEAVAFAAAHSLVPVDRSVG